MQQSTLATLDHEGIADAYNQVYAGYIMPFHVEPLFAQQIEARFDISFVDSPLWLDDAGNVLGLAALAIRGTHGWIGGFGIAEAARGQGLSHALATATIASARAAGISRLWLEVLSPNTRAIRTYERAGFSKTRDLVVLSRTVRDIATPDPGPVQVLPVTPNLISARLSLPCPPAWQRHPQSYPALEGLESLVIGTMAEPRAIAVYQDSATGVSVIDIAAADADAAQRLAGALVRLAPDRALQIINEPADSPLLPALLAAGWTEVIRQYEMVHNLG